jgi:hypothetical protein
MCLYRGMGQCNGNVGAESVLGGRTSIIGPLGSGSKRRQLSGMKMNNKQNDFLHLGPQCPLHHAEKGLATAHSAQHRAITPRQIASALRGAVVFVDLLRHVHILRRDVVPAAR